MDANSILDSLPYYDTDIDNAQLKALVEAEIARELKRTPKPATDPRVPGDFELFKVRTTSRAYERLIDTLTRQNNELLAAELARVQSNKPLNALDTVRYTLPDPAAAVPSEEDWEQALNNARSQLEHQISR